MLLAQHLAEPPRATKPAGPDRTQARTRILRRCEDRIAIAAFRHQRRPAAERLDTDALRRELLERMDSPELAEHLDHDIQHRPIADIIDDICRDMGLGFDDMPGCCPAPRRTPADVALLHAQAAAAPGHMPQPAPHASPVLAPAQAVPATKPQSILVPIPKDPPPDLANMLALCAQLVRDG